MTKINEIYKCDICGNIVEVLHDGAGELVCCGEAMRLLKENTVDAALEKHVPVIERDGDLVTIKVGSVAHPMEEKHYIEWIELIGDTRRHRMFLKPGDKPEATFLCRAEKLSAKEHCNLHGLWKK
ncbi:MAG: desulfoferrodoxin [Candidatus Thermoplasmatota archaeon]|nr:desulfoferrodoxin [Euryarchaeota archaeon]MBU4033062.1 desulfoferrodoxin [Candidatus Thermoplasmatota archaeon]MBU4072100.1 desulfoferrodoxin [Candidatus Thermoplasmatota archaeon]MBU4143683.1 desulfoferrodoxin [Candidatus Thermoplasmatota archaeon]MBU4591803.1 desulfoferrodoxin [Candidatus Thermoplasmatota archaeon]